MFGCGGDRDRGKRPQMGAVAANWPIASIVTSDNPRSEDPRAIVDAIVTGIGTRDHVVELDRRLAIERAIGEASPGDVVLVAGKGHEAYQIVGDRVLPFDDCRRRPRGARAMRVSLTAAVAATGATLFDAAVAPRTLRVSTDTRTIEPGDTFLALRGERFDGHAFTAEAVARGASLLILERADARVEGVATMVVTDTLDAYMALGALARERFEGRVVAITGSAGKTTTKSFLIQLLAARYGDRVAAPLANENNEIGVTKLMLSLSAETHDVAVVEMGARRSGDIAALVEVARPEIGILTNVGEAHLEIMGSRERLEETKWALFSRGARAILNSRDEVSRRRAPSLPQPPDWFAAFDEIAPPAQDAALRPYAAVLGEVRVLYRDDRGESRTRCRRARSGPSQPSQSCRRASPVPSAWTCRSTPSSMPFRTWNCRRDATKAWSLTACALSTTPTMPTPVEWSPRSMPSRAKRVLVASPYWRAWPNSAKSRRPSTSASVATPRAGGCVAGRGRLRRRPGAGRSRRRTRPRIDRRGREQCSGDALAARTRRAGDVVLLKGSRKYQLEEIVEDLRG